MEKIADVLDKLTIENEKLKTNQNLISIDGLLPHVPRQTPYLRGLERYEEIKTKILTHYPGEEIKTIMLTGTTHGGGVSTTTINFANTLVIGKKLKVLLIDVNMRTPRFRDFFEIDHGRGLKELIIDDDNDAFKILKIGQSQLFVLGTGSDTVGPVGLIESKKFDDFLIKARNLFDYILLDAAPIPHFSESRILCDKVDGVVLVIEAGMTRKHVAQRAKKEIQDAGGRILGVVLNRRKFYIPRLIYKRL